MFQQIFSKKFTSDFYSWWAQASKEPVTQSHVITVTYRLSLFFLPSVLLHTCMETLPFLPYCTPPLSVSITQIRTSPFPIDNRRPSLPPWVARSGTPCKLLSLLQNASAAGVIHISTYLHIQQLHIGYTYERYAQVHQRCKIKKTQSPVDLTPEGQRLTRGNANCSRHQLVSSVSSACSNTGACSLQSISLQDNCHVISFCW